MPIQLSGSLVITGSITTTGVITMSGSIASASYSSTSDLLQGTGSVGFTTTASFNAVSSSQQQISSSYIALSASYNTFSGSASTRITVDSSSIQQVSASQQQISSSLLNVIAIGATTGSNSFRANQSITGSLVVSSTITAQTLVVQTVTSSIVYSSGSNIFGCDLNSRQTFTGSIYQTGSIAAFAGSVGIGTQSPSEKLEIYGALKISSVLCVTGLSANSTYIDQTGGTARLLSYGPNSTTRGAITFFQASSTNACQFTGLTLDTSGNATFGGNICSGTINGTTIYGSTAVCSPVGYFSGCVGIGTASPSSLLHAYVNAAATVTVAKFTAANYGYPSNKTYIQIGTQYQDGSSRIGSSNPSGNLSELFFETAIVSSGDFTERMRITSGGNVIVGNSAYAGTTTDLSITGDKVNANGYYSRLIFQNSSQSGGSSASIRGERKTSNYATELTFYTNVGGTAGDGSERMRITCAGYIGIGTCTPAYSLSVISGWIHNYGAQNASGFRYENDASGHVLNLNANNSYAQLYTSTDTSLYFGTNNDIRLKILNTGETCFKCNAYFCSSTYGIMGFGEKVMDKICYITTTSGTLCVALDGLTYSNGPTRAIYLYGTLLDNDAAHYAHMIYFYRNDYGGLQTCTISQASLVHPSTAGQPFTFSVNDPGSTGKSACTLLLRFTSAGAGVAAGSYCTKMRIVVYNVPGL